MKSHLYDVMDVDNFNVLCYTKTTSDTERHSIFKKGMKMLESHGSLIYKVKSYQGSPNQAKWAKYSPCISWSRPP